MTSLDAKAFDPIAYINDPSWHSSCYGLERIRDLLERMGRPQDKLRFVHVAGTNGKGSTSAFVASILKESGYKTGLFTSPYLICFEERIRVNGVMIPLDALTEVTLFVREHAEAIAAETGEHPTEFELMTAVAIEYFAQSGCDIAVLEVGLGGLLDSTNVIDAPEVCVITRIGLDHTGLLGDTVAEIAAQKAGIIKSGAAVISYPQDDATATAAIAQAAKAAACEVAIPDFSRLEIGAVSAGKRRFVYEGCQYETGLLGSYQPCNAAVAIECAKALAARGWRISGEDVARGISETKWEGRFEVVEAGEGMPTIVVDGGHNPQGAGVLAQSLRDLFPDAHPYFVMSVLADKDYRAMLRCILPVASGFVCVTPPNPRALSAADLARTVQELSSEAGIDLARGVKVADSFEDALAVARAATGAGDVICAFGSLYSIADIKQAIAATK